MSEKKLDIANARADLLLEIQKLKQKNEELKKYCCKRNDCGGRLKENHKPTDNEVLTEFEKWLEEEVQKDTYSLYEYNLKQGKKQCLGELQELKEGKK